MQGGGRQRCIKDGLRAVSRFWVSLLVRGGDDLSSLDRIEKARIRLFTTSYCRRFEIAYFQHQIAIVTDADWQAMSADIDSMFSLPGVRAAWGWSRIDRTRRSVPIWTSASLESRPYCRIPRWVAVRQPLAKPDH
jgi:hypothetical protein